MSVRDPLAYFITFRTYGTWLPVDDRGSTDRLHKGWAEPHLVPDPYRRSVAYSRLQIAPVTLRRDQRSSVERAIVGLRSERALTMLKAYATRRLRQAGLWTHDTSPWSRHGSTIYVWDDESLGEVCKYVTERQTSSGGEGAGAPLPGGRGTEGCRVARRVSPSPDAGAGAGDPIVGRVTGQFRERQAAEYAPPSPARRIGGTPERRRL